MKRLMRAFIILIFIFSVLVIISIAESLINTICNNINGDIFITILIVAICGMVIGSIVKPDKF